MGCGCFHPRSKVAAANNLNSSVNLALHHGDSDLGNWENMAGLGGGGGGGGTPITLAQQQRLSKVNPDLAKDPLALEKAKE